MRSYTTIEIKNSFLADDLQRWIAPDLGSLDWQEIDFLTWKHPIDGNHFACIEAGDKLIGMIFEMNAGAGATSNTCSLCGGSNRDIGVKAAFVETYTNRRRKIGTHVCADLRCSERVRGQLPALFSYETISIARRIERLQERIGRFAKRVRQ